MDTDYDKELNHIIENIKQKLVISENNDDSLLENPSLEESFIEPVIKQEESIDDDSSFEKSFIEPVIKHEESIDDSSLEESFIDSCVKYEESIDDKPILEESINVDPSFEHEESIDDDSSLEESIIELSVEQEESINVDPSFEHEESIDDESSLEESINQIQEILNNHKVPIVKLNEVEDNTFSNNHKQKLDEINDERFKKLFDVIIDDEDNTQKNYVVEGVIKNKNYGFCMII